MTKNNKLLLGILAFIVSITIGYAVFTQTVTVTGTATASGTFKITPTCRLATQQELEFYGYINSATYYTSGESCIVNGDSIEVNVTLKQPGAYSYFMITLTNSGTIDAKLKNITATTTTSDASISYFDDEGLVSVSSYDMFKFIDLWDYDLLVGNTKEHLVNLTAGSSKPYLLIVEWTDADEDQTPETLNGTFTFNWEQKTN